MIIIRNMLVLLFVFSIMELVAWWTHKYIMHGILWSMHKDHHQKNNTKFFEKNDWFALIFALPSIVFIIIGTQTGLEKVYFWIGLGISIYGAVYFLAHDIFIHRRIKLFKNSENNYLNAIRRAHKIHHKHLTKENGEFFGFLWISNTNREQLGSSNSIRTGN
jgi:beta-carotene 3-hydroxylase